MKAATKNKKTLAWRLVVYGVALNGLILIGGSLIDQFSIRHIHIHIRFSDDALFGLPLVFGLTLLYLSSLLARRKHTAWLVTTLVYAFILGVSTFAATHISANHPLTELHILRSILLPAVILTGLLASRRDFTVKSDLQSFRQTLPTIVLIIFVTFGYGVSGYMLMDQHDFHHEIGFGEAAHRTIDQFDLTTNKPLVPYTRRARIFSDSLSVISVGAFVYILISLFQPLKARFIDQSVNRERMKALLDKYPSSSEDFFKLWPHDKYYFFNDEGDAGLAFGVHRGVAMVVGDPAGDQKNFNALLDRFDEVCHGNDWRVAFIHTDPKFNKLYESHGFKLQKIGEEAVVELEHFQAEVARNKYFRHINNKFSKQGFTTEILQPPHHQALINRLRTISDEWLNQPGRAERGLMMGYFSEAYMQQCDLMVVRDEAGTIQAFLNQIYSFDHEEANYDLLRHTHDSPGNINDFLMLNFINYLHGQGFKRFNLGLCPLAGMDKEDGDSDIVGSALKFFYANGDRLYSFSGLHRFKSKYEPNWSSRYIVYRGGIRNFTRTINTLNGAMKVSHHRLH